MTRGVSMCVCVFWYKNKQVKSICMDFRRFKKRETNFNLRAVCRARRSAIDVFSKRRSQQEPLFENTCGDKEVMFNKASLSHAGCF